MRKTQAVGLVGLLLILSPAGAGPKATSAAGDDPFIVAIETAKRSVAPLDCLDENGTKILRRLGTASFVSNKGDFVTAAHVLQDMKKGEPSCPIAAIILPVGSWRPETREESQVWFAFQSANCVMDHDLDVARCRPDDDLSVPKNGVRFKITPVEFEWTIPPDGTQIAFTGFPLQLRDPLTVRASVASYQTVWENDKPVPRLLVDHVAWPGSSGSPVYLANGRVIAILIGGGKDEATGMTIVRPALPIRDMLAKKTGE